VLEGGVRARWRLPAADADHSAQGPDAAAPAPSAVEAGGPRSSAPAVRAYDTLRAAHARTDDADRSVDAGAAAPAARSAYDPDRPGRRARAPTRRLARAVAFRSTVAAPAGGARRPHDPE